MSLTFIINFIKITLISKTSIDSNQMKGVLSNYELIKTIGKGFYSR